MVISTNKGQFNYCNFWRIKAALFCQNEEISPWQCQREEFLSEMWEVAVTSSKTCGLSFCHAFLKCLFLTSFRERLNSYPQLYLGRAGIAVPAVTGLQPRCGTEKLVSKCGIPCWKKPEYLLTDVLVLAFPKIALSFNEISPLNREKVLFINCVFGRILDTWRPQTTFCSWALFIVHVEHILYVYMFIHI